MQQYKKKLLLCPSAYSPKAFADIQPFLFLYKDEFDVYVIVKGNQETVDKISGVTYVDNSSILSFYLKVSADYIIDAGSINGTLRISKFQKWVSVWHGIPYKKMFIDLPGLPLKTTLYYESAYDFMISMSPYYTDVFLRNAMMYNGEILEIGSAKVDPLFNIEESDITAIKNKYNLPLDKKIILYAPTYREEGVFKLPFEPLKILENFGEEAIIITKLHYLCHLDKNYDGVIDLTNSNSIIDLLKISDALISDYSSLIMDYSLLGRKIVLFQYDYETYEAKRGTYFNFEDYLPTSNIVKTEEQLYQVFKDSKNLKEDNSLMVNKFYPWDQGDSAIKIKNALNFDNTPYTHKEIIFLVNILNEIGGIHTFINNMAKYYKTKYNTKIYVIGVKEFADNQNEFHLFNSKYVDVAISYERNAEACKAIIKETDGYILTLQYWAQKTFQEFMSDKNNILMFHGDTKDIVDRNLYTWHLDSLNNGSIYNYKKLLFLTKTNMEIIQEHLNKDVQKYCDYIPNSIEVKILDNEIERQSDSRSKDVPTNFAYIGRIAEDKNALALLDLAKAIKKANKPYRINIYGDGTQVDKLHDGIQEYQLEDVLIYHGYESNKDIIFSDNDALILLSKSEGMPLVILEAYQYLKPVLIFDTFSSSKDLVDEGLTGFRIKTDDFEAFVEKMGQINTLSKEAITNKLNEFSNENIMENYWEPLFASVADDQSYPKVLIDKNPEKFSLKQIYIKAKRKRRDFLKKYINEDQRSHLLLARMESYNKKLEAKELSKLKNRPLISIIIPCFNNADTIRSTIKSVLNQKYKNVEIIVIEDGSEYSSKKIVEGINSDKVKYIINEVNLGPSLTRNKGIDLAKGKYIFFLDGDDQLLSGALSLLVSNAEENNLNVVAGQTIRYHLKTKVISYWYKELYRKNTIDYLHNRKDLYKDTLSTNKLYRLDYLKENNLYFEKILYEDKLFTASLYTIAPEIGIINRPIYKWNVAGANTSTTTTKNLENFQQRMEAVYKTFAVLPERLKPVMFAFFISHDCRIYINEFLNYDEKEKREIYDTAVKFFMQYQDYYFEKLITVIENKELAKCLANNDYERYVRIADIISEKYFREINAKK